MRLIFNRLGAVWLLLLLATAMTAWLTGLDGGRHWATSAIFAIAAVKIALVMGCFMELAAAPRVWKYVFGAWLLVVTTMLIAGFAVA